MATRKFNNAAIVEQRKKLNSAIREAQIECEHKTDNGPILKSVHDPDVMVKGKNNMGDKYYVCENCGDIINFETFTESMINDAMHVLYGMCNQAKVLGNLQPNEYDDICEIIRVLDTVQGSLMPFYLQKLIKELSKKNKGGNNRNNNRNTKGRINIGGSFNR